MPRFTPWLAMVHAKALSTIKESHRAFEFLSLDGSSHLSLVVMVGRRAKSEILTTLLRGGDDEFLANPHAQVFLWQDPRVAESVYVDFELHGHDMPQWTLPECEGPSATHDVNWLEAGATAGPVTRSRVANLVCGRVIAPLSDVICYFAADFGGVKAVASLLAAQMNGTPPSDMPPECLPRVTVVVETVAKSFSHHAAEKIIIETISQDLKLQQSRNADTHTEVRKYFNQISVISVRKDGDLRTRSGTIHKHIQNLRREAVTARRSRGYLFTREHVSVFTGASRPRGFTLQDFSFHLVELFTILPAEIWMWHLACPLIASAILAASYPPGCHAFPMDLVFKKLFGPPIKKAISGFFVQSTTRDGMFTALQKQSQLLYKDLISGVHLTALDIHARQLLELKPYLAQVRSNKTCLVCLMRTPEKVLSCGHAICDDCVHCFGYPSKDAKYTFLVGTCPLCGANNECTPIELIPPTAGIRILSIDGGGGRGIIPLVFLKRIQDALERLEILLRESFDLVCGTSTGGLITIGLFLMRWPMVECLQKFQSSAERTFRRKASCGALGKVQELALSYIRDGRYTSAAIEESFRSVLGEDIKMFNPLSCDTRVAVTTTTAKCTRPCLFSNYNGGIRPDKIGYSMIRAPRFEDDVCVSQVASCTSAAPWFFRPKTIYDIGTFQDGGLQHNNPLKIALWELKFMWPNKSSPDFALSIGTGVSDSLLAGFSAGPHSPVRERFLTRIFNTFMRSLDGEKIWSEIYNGLAEDVKSRFHRLNLTLKGVEPAIDDTSAMAELQRQADEQARPDRFLRPVLDSIFASMFYFEFDSMPVFRGGRYACSGTVFCRTRLSPEGRRKLCIELKDTSSYFLICGQPIACVDRIPKSVPLFKRRVTFSLQSLSENVRITIRGITSQPLAISGLPNSAQDLLEAQGLDAPFGRSDHWKPEKPLPLLPTKRKLPPDLQ